METLNNYIVERIRIDNVKSKPEYKYHPKNKQELEILLNKLIKERGNGGDFNDIDTSRVSSMDYLFYSHPKFNGHIEYWDVSYVMDMTGMFEDCEYFNCDISGWNTKRVEGMSDMFKNAESFTKNISGWDVDNVRISKGMFHNCPIPDVFKPIMKWK